MPKEYIDAPQHAVSGGAEEVNINPFRVRVGWDRHGGGVQIATVDENDGNDGSGFFVNLDRLDINALIRLLRKARDQCYGRDE